jgi:hypothetical protein
MKKSQILLLIALSIAIFILVYYPHINYKYPLHIDEWHGIQEAIKLGNGTYDFTGRIGYRTMGFELGFHLFLLVLLKLVNLISVYQFLPATWAVLSALILFFLVYWKTKKFEIAFFSMLFFASIKSNVNLGGIWFFTPLDFAIPFVFLYLFFFIEGIEKENKKYILISLGIMILLVFFHVISILFAIPFLFIYLLFNLKFIKKEYKFFSIFFILFLVAIIFYSAMQHASISSLAGKLWQDMQFKKGWGVLELKNSFYEIYSLTGYILAMAGLVGIYFFEEKPKKYLAYILWPITLLISIWIFRATDISYLSPYQRNFYYFALSLPLLSALGFYYLLATLRKYVGNMKMSDKTKSNLKVIITLVAFAILVYLIFWNYYNIPKQINVYHLMEERDDPSLVYLSTLPHSRIMTTIDLSTVLYPISKQEPVGTIWFYGNRSEVDSFFKSPNCSSAQQILDRNNVSYIMSRAKLSCDWKLIYDKDNFIYQVR